MSQRWGVELAIALLFAAALTAAVVYFRGREPLVGPRRRIMTTGTLTALGAVAFLLAWTASEPAAPVPTVLAVAPPRPPVVTIEPRVSDTPASVAPTTPPAPGVAVPAPERQTVPKQQAAPKQQTVRTVAPRAPRPPVRTPAAPVAPAPAPAPAPLPVAPAVPAAPVTTEPAPVTTEPAAEGDPGSDDPTGHHHHYPHTPPPSATPEPTTTPEPTSEPTAEPTVTPDPTG